jgi:hypothetical protein
MNKNVIMIGCAAVLMPVFWAGAAQYNPFASRVIDISLNPGFAPSYLPAPGGMVNDPVFNDANSAIGVPSGGGLFAQNNGSVVSLGGFGGCLVLAFDHDVRDDSANPMGLDAIVYSNAYYMLNTNQMHWSEFATIEIMPELNDNDIAGDAPGEIWYLIPGSHLSNSNTFRIKTWDKSTAGYPNFIGWPDSYNCGAYELLPYYQTIYPPGVVGVLVNPNYPASTEGYWGYAEYTPTLKLGDRDCDDDDAGVGDVNTMKPELFYTVPDDPFTVGVSKGSGGGDAFDIAWAVDPSTWQAADLRSFRYIRLTTAVDRTLGALGEISAEIDAVADVRPLGDVNGDDEVNYVDLFCFGQAWLSQWGQTDFNPAADMLVDNKVDFTDFAKFAQGWGARK